MAFVQSQNRGWRVRKTRTEKLKPLGYPAHPFATLYVYYVWRLFLLCFVLLYNVPWQANLLSDSMYTVHRPPKPITQTSLYFPPTKLPMANKSNSQSLIPPKFPTHWVDCNLLWITSRVYQHSQCPLRMEPPFPIVHTALQYQKSDSRGIRNQNTGQRHMIARKDQMRNLDTKVWSSDRKWMHGGIHY